MDLRRRNGTARFRGSDYDGDSDGDYELNKDVLYRSFNHRSARLERIMGTNEHDLVVIGGGPGGYVAAIRAAQQD